MKSSMNQPATKSWRCLRMIHNIITGIGMVVVLIVFGILIGGYI